MVIKVVERLSPKQFGDKCRVIKEKLMKAAIKVLKFPEFGFSEDEIVDYLFVEVDSYDSDTIRCEVRCELTYSGMWDLAEMLNPIVAKYDSESYFDIEEPGIMSAYIRI